VEIWRYYLLSVRPEQSDSIFAWEDLQAKTNNELLANFGNLCHRVLSFLCARCDSKVPAPSQRTSEDEKFIALVSEHVRDYVAALEKVSLKEGLRIFMEVSRAGNLYMQQNKPWELLKTDPARCSTVLYILVNLIHQLAILAEPYMPSLTAKLFGYLRLPVPVAPLAGDAHSFVFALPAHHAIAEPQPLVVAISAEQVAEFRGKFGGNFVEEGEKFQLALKAGRITAVTPHPSNEAAWVATVDVAEGKARTIVAAIKAVYPEARSLVGKTVLVLVNIASVKIGEVESQGMLLTGAKGKDLGLLTTTAAIGSTAVPQKGLVAPAVAFNVRKELKKVPLKTAAGGVVLYGDAPLLADGQPVTAERVGAGASIK